MVAAIADVYAVPRAAGKSFSYSAGRIVIPAEGGNLLSAYMVLNIVVAIQITLFFIRMLESKAQILASEVLTCAGMKMTGRDHVDNKWVLPIPWKWSDII